jgi:hypothetical protein
LVFQVVSRIGPAYVKYAATLVDNGVDGSVLASLSPDELSESLSDLGFSTLHRKVVLKNLHELMEGAFDLAAKAVGGSSNEGSELNSAPPSSGSDSGAQGEEREGKASGGGGGGLNVPAAPKVVVPALGVVVGAGGAAAAGALGGAVDAAGASAAGQAAGDFLGAAASGASAAASAATSGAGRAVGSALGSAASVAGSGLAKAGQGVGAALASVPSLAADFDGGAVLDCIASLASCAAAVPVVGALAVALTGVCAGIHEAKINKGAVRSMGLRVHEVALTLAELLPAAVSMTPQAETHYFRLPRSAA